MLVVHLVCHMIVPLLQNVRIYMLYSYPGIVERKFNKRKHSCEPPIKHLDWHLTQLSPSQRLALFKLVNPLNLLAIPFVLRIRSGKPRVQDLLRDSLCRCPQAECKHVSVVPDARSTSGLGIVAESGADAGDFVGGDRGSRAGPAEDNPFVCFMCCHTLSHFATGKGPVHFGVVFCQWSNEKKVVSSFLQFFDDCIGKVSTFIAAHCNFHS